MNSVYSFQSEEDLFLYQKAHCEHRMGTIIWAISGCLINIQHVLPIPKMVSPRYKRKVLSKSQVMPFLMHAALINVFKSIKKTQPITKNPASKCFNCFEM